MLHAHAAGLERNIPMSNQSNCLASFHANHPPMKTWERIKREAGKWKRWMLFAREAWQKETKSWRGCVQVCNPWHTKTITTKVERTSVVSERKKRGQRQSHFQNTWKRAAVCEHLLMGVRLQYYFHFCIVAALAPVLKFFGLFAPLSETLALLYLSYPVQDNSAKLGTRRSTDRGHLTVSSAFRQFSHIWTQLLLNLFIHSWRGWHDPMLRRLLHPAFSGNLGFSPWVNDAFTNPDAKLLLMQRDN